MHIILLQKNQPKIIKSENDAREYRAVTLKSNSLRMTLISDANATESGKKEQYQKILFLN